MPGRGGDLGYIGAPGWAGLTASWCPGWAEAEGILLTEPFLASSPCAAALAWPSRTAATLLEIEMQCLKIHSHGPAQSQTFVNPFID